MSVVNPIFMQIIEENPDGISGDDLVDEMLRRLTPEQYREMMIELKPEVDRAFREMVESN